MRGGHCAIWRRPKNHCKMAPGSVALAGDSIEEIALARPVHLQRIGGSVAAGESIETTLEDGDIDIIASIIGELPARSLPPGSEDFVKMDRYLNDLFEGTFELNARGVAMRIGAVASRMYMVDLRQVAVRASEILNWAAAQKIVYPTPSGDGWSLKRTGVTFLPFGKGGVDARTFVPDAGATSIDGLVSREEKQRARLRKKEEDFCLIQVGLLLSAVPDHAELPVEARQLLFPCATVGDLKTNIAAMTAGLDLWQIVRVQWHAERLHRQEIELQDFADLSF